MRSSDCASEIQRNARTKEIGNSHLLPKLLLKSQYLVQREIREIRVHRGERGSRAFPWEPIRLLAVNPANRDETHVAHQSSIRDTSLSSIVASKIVSARCEKTEEASLVGQIDPRAIALTQAGGC